LRKQCAIFFYLASRCILVQKPFLLSFILLPAFEHLNSCLQHKCCYLILLAANRPYLYEMRRYLLFFCQNHPWLVSQMDVSVFFVSEN